MTEVRPLTRQDIIDCTECRDHQIDQPHLVGACASVGIERGLSTHEMMFRYLAGFHRRGHKERDRV